MQPFSDWYRQNPVGNNMLWKGAAEDQFGFVRGPLSNLFMRRPKEVQVVGEHRSKSIPLPVYLLERPDVGLRVFLRDNFYDWKMSVETDVDFDVRFDGLFRTSPEGTGNELHPVYFEGFDRSWVHGYYDQRETKRGSWSASVHSNEKLWTALFLMLREVGGLA